MNLVILRGALSRPPEARDLRSGDVVVSYDVTVRGREGVPAESVPVVWFAPPAGSADLERDNEVVADKVIPARRAKAAQRAVTDALAEAEEAFIAPAA